MVWLDAVPNAGLPVQSMQSIRFAGTTHITRGFPMRVAKIYLIFMAVMSIVFGVIYLFNPSAMMAPMGFGTLAPSALTDARATYGGLQIGMGVFLLLCL